MTYVHRLRIAGAILALAAVLTTSHVWGEPVQKSRVKRHQGEKKALPAENDDTFAADTWKGRVQRVSDWFTEKRNKIFEPFMVNDVRTLDIRLSSRIDRPYRFVPLAQMSEQQKRIYQSWLCVTSSSRLK